MTSRRNIFIIGFAVLAFALYLSSGAYEEFQMREEIASVPTEAPSPIESVDTEELFEADGRRAVENETTPPVQEEEVQDEDTEGQEVWCSMEARQCPDGSFVGRTGPNCEFAQCPGVEEESATSTPLPTMTIHSEGMTREGTTGSYCWDEMCQTSIITNLPYDPLPVSASSTLTFSVDATTPPERLFYFLKEVDGTEIVFQRDLTSSEISSGAFQVEPLSGEYLLFLTGIWPGGEDVASAFKIEII